MPLYRLIGAQLLLVSAVMLAAKVHWITFLLVLAAFLTLSYWMGRKLIFPIEHLLRRAKATEDSVLDSELASDKHEEWEELESALGKIQSDLRQKTDTLTREREELATLMAAISDAILAVDPEGVPLFFNSRFAVLFLEKELQLRHARLGEIFRDPEVLEAFHATYSEGTAREIEVPLFTKDNPLQGHFSISISPLKKENGTIYGVVGVFHDITEMKRAERIRIEFVANVSHELRTPLTSIKGYTDTLREDVAQGRLDAAAASKFLEIISRNSDRLLHLIEDLLDLSSLEFGESEPTSSKQVIDTRDLTERVITQLQAKINDKRHTVRTVVEAPSIRSDAGRAEQVLVNLLENAIKYTPMGGKIEIRWSTSPKGVALHVIDNGPGIPSEHQPRLFERFYRVDQARSRELGGTGLGLAIVKHIMQRKGGSAWVRSEIGKGSEFVCEFPN